MESIITVENLSFSYGKKVVLEDINFSVKKGTAAVLVGENGSGKSTLIACLAGILRPSGGNVDIKGKTVYVPQDISLVEELTFNDNLEYFASLASCKVPDTLPFGADKYRKIRIKNMSGGMKKLCSICCAIISDADIYMFDEPCAALDCEHREMLIDYICTLLKNNKTILYVGHNEKEYSPFANTVITIDKTHASVCTLTAVKNEKNI